MAQLMTVRLTRNDGQPWGFRLQGGKDFGSPLALQKVNVGSIADKAGLLAGDALIKVNTEELFNLRHKDAQDSLVRAGNSFELTVSRGGSTWKPSVTPLTSPVPTSAGVNVVTRTSLQAKPGQNPAAIGTGHNTAARPFNTNGVKSIANKQYNSPVAMYSDETIAETLSAQTEVLAGGVLGVNFKKNEKVYNSAQSEVFKMLQEQGHEPEPARPSSVYSPSTHFAPHHLPEQPSVVAPVTQHVTAPVHVAKPPSNNGLPPGQNICADCERLIVGVFVRIKDKNLHVECFKCSTCGNNLKNQGYYNLNNKLYCDIHARLAALSSPPPNSNGMVPVTMPPKAPTSTISSALSAHANAFNGSAPIPTTAHCLSSVDIVLSSPGHSRTSSVSSGYGNSNSSLKNSPINQSPSHSRQSSGVSLNELKMVEDSLDGLSERFPQVSDEDKEDISGNLYYKTINGGIIRSVKPFNKNNGEVRYKLPSTISGPKPFSYAPLPSSNFGPASPPQAVSAPKSPIAYPPPAAPAWAAPVSAPAPAPAWTPVPAESLKAPAAQSLQESKMLLLSYIREEEGRPEVLKGYEEEISRSNTPAFHWPPKPPSEEEERVALAAPIYVPPPETQHIQPKPRPEKGQMLPPSAQKLIDKQSISAPQLALMQGPSDASMYSEQPEVYSDNSASTSTSTGDSSSEEYQVYSTNVSQQVVRYFDEPKQNPINAAVDYASNYAAMLRHKPSICSVGADSYVSDRGYENSRMAEVEEAYMVREPSEPRMVDPEYDSQRRTKRVGFTMPPEEVQDERESSLSREFRRQSPRSVEGRHGPLYPNTVQIQHDLDSYYQERRESDMSYQYEQDVDRRQSYQSYQSNQSYDDSRRESEVTSVEDKTLPFIQQYCTGDTRYALLKLDETKPCPLPISPNVNSLPQQYQSQMLKALTITPKEVEKDMDDPFERARQAAYDQQIEDDRKARDNERRKLMDEMLAKQRAMRERQERNEQDQARRFAPVSKLAPRTPDDWRPPQPTPTIPLPEEKDAYIPPPPTMEPIRIGPLKFPRMESPLLEALKTASIRPYTPFSNEVASQLMDMPTPVQQMTFSSALITAPDRPFTPHNEMRDYNASPVPYTPAPDYSRMPTEIYKENEEQIRFLEEEVDQRFERRNSAFAKIKAVKPATPVHMRRRSSNANGQQMNFPFTDDQIPESPRPIVCVPEECLSTYQSMCSVQQRAYGNGENQQRQDLVQQQRQQERIRQQQIQQQQQMQLRQQQEERVRYQQHQQQQQQIRRQSQDSNRQNTQIQSKTSQLPPPHPSARVPSSPRRVQSQAQSPVLLKPDPAGLHKADDIPGYQRKWFNLPSQRASITPEPHELRENVPLAFLAAPKEPSPTISKPIAISAANTYTTTYANLSSSQNSYSNTYESQYHQAMPQLIRKQLAIEPRYSITESQVTSSVSAPQEEKHEQEQEEVKPVSAPEVVAPEDPPTHLVGTNPTEMLEQSVRQLKINTIKTPKFRNEASQVISAMLEARLKQNMPKTAPDFPPPPPLPKCSPPKYDPIAINLPSSIIRPSEEILSIIPTDSKSDICQKRNKINNNYNNANNPNSNKMHATNRLSYVEKCTNHNNNNNECLKQSQDHNDIVDGLKNGKRPVCNKCNVEIIGGPFITALGRIWCPEHFICVNANCKRPLADIGFVEEKGDLYCEYCFEQYLAPNCSKCVKKIKGDCLNAIGKQFHPECFTCSHCGKLFGNSPFFLEEGEPFCQNDWNQLFTTKCFACGFPVEAGDRWVEALNNNYHSQCFNCTMCKKNLEGQSFYAKGGRPFCKNHAR